MKEGFDMVSSSNFGTNYTHVGDTIVIGNRVTINGEKLPPAPKRKGGCNVTTIGRRVFINGYEWKNGQWKKTLRALWHLWF